MPNFSIKPNGEDIQDDGRSKAGCGPGYLRFFVGRILPLFLTK
jgi:hypothetical protein